METPSAASRLQLEARVSALEARAAAVQTNVPGDEQSEAQRRVAAALTSARVLGSALVRVPGDYYGRPLAARAALLGCSPEQLCKTIVLENSAAGTVAGSPDAPLSRARFVCVVLQYTARLKMEALARFLGDASLAMAPLEVADALTGFPHNAMTVFGMRSPMPVIIAKAAVEAAAAAPLAGFVWLGGGDVDVKLRVFVKQLLRPDVLAPAVAVLDCTVPRADEEDA